MVIVTCLCLVRLQNHTTMCLCRRPFTCMSGSYILKIVISCTWSQMLKALSRTSAYRVTEEVVPSGYDLSPNGKKKLHSGTFPSSCTFNHYSRSQQAQTHSRYHCVGARGETGCVWGNRLVCLCRLQPHTNHKELFMRYQQTQQQNRNVSQPSVCLRGCKPGLIPLQTFTVLSSVLAW